MELKAARQRALDSRTCLGHARNGLGYAMSAYCVYKLFASAKALVFGEDFSSDPVSRWGCGGVGGWGGRGRGRGVARAHRWRHLRPGRQQACERMAAGRYAARAHSLARLAPEDGAAARRGPALPWRPPAFHPQPLGRPPLRPTPHTPSPRASRSAPPRSTLRFALRRLSHERLVIDPAALNQYVTLAFIGAISALSIRAFMRNAWQVGGRCPMGI